MIKSFGDTWLRNFFVDDKHSKKIPTVIRDRLFRKLQLLDDAVTGMDLRCPPSNHFEQLSGTLSGMHSIRINDQWRLIFKWNEESGEAENVYLDDHGYK